MKKIMFSMWFTLVFVFAIVFSSFAEEAKPAGLNLDELKKELGLSIYLQGGYTYNFKNPDSQENDFRLFDHKANSFTLDLAQIVFAKEAPVGGVGYKLKISAGETAKFIHSRGLGASDSDPAGPNNDNAFDLTEAYVDYVAPLGKGLKLRFGKFVTYFGAEVIEARDNPNYSRSILFNYAIPFTHTGLMAGYTFSDAIGANIYLANGWDNSDDNNKGKSVGLNLNITPMEQLAMAFNLMYGPEQNNSSNERFLFDWVGTIKPMKNLTFILNADYATDKNGAPDGADAKWYGYAGIAKYDFSDLFSLSLRAEYFDDCDGARTGTAQKLKEVTLTPEFRIAKTNIIVRPEYRHDWSDEKSFDSGSKKKQDTIALGVMYTW